MGLIVCGLNHNTAPVEVRERWSLSREQSRQALEVLRGKTRDSEHLILSTCNRTEFYSRAPKTSTEIERNIHFYKEVREIVGGQNIEITNLDHFYIHRQQKVVEHLFRLAASIDSMVVGESQILKQIKDAFSIAEETESTEKHFRKLFPAALRTGKRVRS